MLKKVKNILMFPNGPVIQQRKKDHKLDELIEEIEEREMPLASYTWTHKEAQLTDAQVQSLVDWARNVRSGYSLHTNHD